MRITLVPPLYVIIHLKPKVLFMGRAPYRTPGRGHRPIRTRSGAVNLNLSSSASPDSEPDIKYLPASFPSFLAIQFVGVCSAANTPPTVDLEVEKLCNCTNFAGRGCRPDSAKFLSLVRNQDQSMTS